MENTRPHSKLAAPVILLAHTPEMRANYYGEQALDALQRLGTVLLHEADAPLGPVELIASATEADIIVADRMTAGPAEVFAALPKLAAFVRVAVDIRNIDVGAASRAGVLVTRASPGFVDAVAELTVGFMVDLSRGISRSVRDYVQGVKPAVRMGRQLSGNTLGLIGYGSIGRRMAALGEALHMRVLVTDPHVTVPPGALVQTDLPTLLADSDYVVCLAVATPETENLIDADAFARMKEGAFFINVSRGNLVDEDALQAAVADGRIGGAALDVGRAADQMPSPHIAALPNVIATPHIGGLTIQAVEHQALETARQVEVILRGEVPAGAVNAGHWHRRSLVAGRH